MTTIVYRDGKMCGDGQITRYECLIEATEFVKVMNIGNCLIGAAGNGMSIVKFFDWFADKVEAEWAQAEYEHLTVLPPEDLVEEDFQALVVNPEGQIFEYVGTKNVFPVSSEYSSIGSGCLYAYPLLDAGFSAKQAVEGAIKRCPFSGGTITEVGFEEEVKPLTEEAFDNMSKEEIKALLFGEPEVIGEDLDVLAEISVEEDVQVKYQDFIVPDWNVIKDGDYILTVSSKGIVSDNICSGDFESFLECDADFEYLVAVAKALNVKHSHNIGYNTLADKLDRKIKEIQQSLIDNTTV
ncbi:nucleophile aminohydrolase [Vibrio phage 1.084.O._10N.261.49.F5]|nr:nucleophile aminohydrolase [Vibrio phage 1.084.O._10N.261.49.F5]